MDDTRALVDALTWSGRADPMRGAHAYARRVQDAAAVLDALADSDPKAARPLLKLAVNRVTRALTRVDSSSSIAGHGLDQLIRAYARACQSAPPAPTPLAKWLCALHFEGPGWPAFRLVWFKDALGAKGLALIEHATQERAATAAGSSAQEFEVRSFREQLAEASGDVDHYISVLSEDLRSAHDHLPIVDALRAAGRVDDAQAWARRGPAKTPAGAIHRPVAWPPHRTAAGRRTREGGRRGGPGRLPGPAQRSRLRGSAGDGTGRRDVGGRALGRAGHAAREGRRRRPGLGIPPGRHSA